MTNTAAPVGGSLAVRYRPRRFADVVGQTPVKRALQRAVSTGQVPRQILFSGGSGLGKTTLARICAAALLCEVPLSQRPDGDSCARCASCLDVITGSHPDVIEIDAASNGRVDEIRELASRAHLAPMRGAVRVYIIDEAHGLSAAGGQAFLKLLEEPPAHVVFMLATTDPDRMLHTNRSRCTQFDLSAPRPGELADNLLRVAAAEGVVIDQTTASEIVAASSPELGVRGTLMSLEKVLPLLADGTSAAEALGQPSSELLESLYAAIASRDPGSALSSLASLRSRNPIDKLLAALSTRIAAALVDAVSAGDLELSHRMLAASDLLIAARRDGSELAAVACIVKLATSGIALASSSLVRESVFEDEPRQAPLRPAPAIPAIHPDEASGTQERHRDGAPSPDSSPQAPAPHARRGEADQPDLESPVAAARAEYLCDPFLDEDQVRAPEPTAHSSPVPPSDGSDALRQVVSVLGGKNTPPSRLLASKLRPVSATLRGSELVLECPAHIRTALEKDLELLTAAAGEAGFSVSLS